MKKKVTKLYKKLGTGGTYQQQVDENNKNIENSQIISGTGSKVAGAFGPIGTVVGAGLNIGNTLEKTNTMGGNVASSILAPSAIGMVDYGLKQVGDNGWKGVGNTVLNTASGGIYGKEQARKNIAKAKEQQNSLDTINSGNFNYQQALVSGFNPQGQQEAQYYKNGGSLYDKMKEGGSIHIKPENKGKFTEYKERTGKTTEEALHSSDPHVRKMANFAKNASHWNHGAMGGSLDNLSEENQEVKGNSHEEGGVKFPEEKLELEGGETINKGFVFSDELGFAQKHKPIAKAIGKLEKKPTSNINRATLDRLKEREENLKVEQEQTKQQLGIPNDLDMKKYGGKLYSKMGGGGTLKLTPEELDKVNQAKNNGTYKDTIGSIIGYNAGTRFPAGSEGWKQKQKEFDAASDLTNRGLRPKVDNTGKVVGYKSVFKDGGSLYKKMWDGGSYDKDGNLINNIKYGDPNLNPSSRGSGTDSNWYNSRYGNGYSEDAVNALQDTSKNPNMNNSSNNTNWQGIGNGVAGYADNITNFALNRQRAKVKVPNEGLVDPLNPIKYDFSASKAEADRQRIGFNKGIDQFNTNSGEANTNKAVGLAQTIAAKNQINQEELNANNQEKARIQGANASIQGQNNRTVLNNRLRQIMAKDDIRREDSTNVSNLVSKNGVAQNDAKLEGILRDQNGLNIAGKDPKTVAILMRSNRDVFKRNGWTDQQIDSYISNADKSSNIDFNRKATGGSIRKKMGY